MRPDFDRYATGYLWLDKLTLPFWTLYSKWHEWRFYRFLGKGDAKRGREIMKRAVEMHYGTDVSEHVHELPQPDLSTGKTETVEFKGRWL